MKNVMWVIASLMLMIGLATPSLGAETTATVHKLTKQEMTIFRQLINHPSQARSNPRLDPILCRAARKKAVSMAKLNYFNHVSPSGQGPNHLVRSMGYILPSHYDKARSGNNIESIAIDAGAIKAFSEWMKSTPHKTHLLGLHPFYSEQISFGVGVAKHPQYPGSYIYVVLSAPPNTSKKPPFITLKNPAGKTITTTKALIP